jgi:monothiol glutaredoxin
MLQWDTPAHPTRKYAMSRPILDETRIHPAIRNQLSENRQAIVREVISAIAANDVVVVGMSVNPFVKKARKALEAAGQPFKYLEYGSYLSQWRERNAIKMWSGWPTLPMVFVKGVLVGGATDLQKLIDNGELKTLMQARAAT